MWVLLILFFVKLILLLGALFVEAFLIILITHLFGWLIMDVVRRQNHPFFSMNTFRVGAAAYAVATVLIGLADLQRTGLLPYPEWLFVAWILFTTAVDVSYYFYRRGQGQKAIEQKGISKS